MCSLGDGRDFWLKSGQMFCALFILLNFFSLEYFSILYVVEHYQMGDIDRNLFVLIQVIGTFPSIVSFCSLVYRMASVRRYFDKMQHIFDQCNCKLTIISVCVRIIANYFPDKCTPSAVIYVQTNDLCEKFIKWAITFIATSYMASTLVPIIVGAVFFCIRDGFVKTENLYLPLKMKYATPVSISELFTSVS